jgi:hypothetical protein
MISFVGHCLEMIEVKIMLEKHSSNLHFFKHLKDGNYILVNHSLRRSKGESYGRIISYIFFSK